MADPSDATGPTVPVHVMRAPLARGVEPLTLSSPSRVPAGATEVESAAEREPSPGVGVASNTAAEERRRRALIRSGMSPAAAAGVNTARALGGSPLTANAGVTPPVTRQAFDALSESDAAEEEAVTEEEKSEAAARVAAAEAEARLSASGSSLSADLGRSPGRSPVRGNRRGANGAHSIRRSPPDVSLSDSSDGGDGRNDGSQDLPRREAGNDRTEAGGHASTRRDRVHFAPSPTFYDTESGPSSAASASEPAARASPARRLRPTAEAEESSGDSSDAGDFRPELELVDGDDDDDDDDDDVIATRAADQGLGGQDGAAAGAGVGSSTDGEHDGSGSRAERREAKAKRRARKKKDRVLMPEAPRPGYVARMEDMDVAELSSSPEVFDRELSELNFFWRVLYESMDRNSPLLERIKFLAITASNVDGFMGKRLGNLRKQRAEDLQTIDDDSEYTPQLDLVADTINAMNTTMAQVFTEDLAPGLERYGIRIVPMDELNDEEIRGLAAYFKSDVAPILNPVMVDSRRHFPANLLHLSLNIAAIITTVTSTSSSGVTTGGAVRLVVCPIPDEVGRWIHVGSERLGAYAFVSMESFIEYFLPVLYPKQDVQEASVFRVTRDYFVDDSTSDPEDMFAHLNKAVSMLRFRDVTRIEVAATMDAELLRALMHYMKLSDIDVYVHEDETFLGFESMMFFVKLPFPELKYEPWTPKCHPRLTNIQGKLDGKVPQDKSHRIFDEIRQKDIYVQFPYHTFQSTVQLLLDSAAIDPDVLSVRMTWYRAANNNILNGALARAAAAGKQVTVCIELKASFEEQVNIDYATELEAAGVTVVYGLEAKKVHGKIIEVIRREEGTLRSYVCIATGNFNSSTASLYIDVALMTARKAITEDINHVFHFLIGGAVKPRFKVLLVSPLTMHAHFVKLIAREADHARSGGTGHIIARINGCTDKTITKALYEASMAGVRIDLLVRGMCRLRPGLQQSKNIRVISYVGRFLEHARIFYFFNKGAPRYYLGSADWMSRNLKFRTEVVTPIMDREIQERIRAEMELYMHDEGRDAWYMRSDGRYIRRAKRPNQMDKGVWARLMNMADERHLRASRDTLHLRKNFRKWQQPE